MKFFHYRQNNSGGSFGGPAINVIVEAPNAEVANALAREAGVYFDGCETGRDCSCCGDRWCAKWDDERGNDEPTVYGRTIHEHLTCNAGILWGHGKLPEVMVYYFDGTKQTFFPPKKADAVDAQLHDV